jgi:hypothetical protein
MRVADLVTAAAFILLGAVVIADALRLGVGWGSDGPKSGFFPFWLAVFMVAASALIVLQAVRERSRRPFVTPSSCARCWPCSCPPRASWC